MIEIEEDPKVWEIIGGGLALDCYFLAGFMMICGSAKKRRVIPLSIGSAPISASLPVSIPTRAPLADRIPVGAPASAPSPPTPFSKPGEDFHCSAEAAQKIHRLFTQVADLNLLWLGWNCKNLEELGHEIEYKDRVHPFGLLKASPQEKIQKMFRDFIKKKKRDFIDGIERGIIKNHAINIEPQIAPFAKEMNKDPDEIRRLIQERKWEQLVRYTLELS